MTIVTHVTLREDAGPEWDATVRDRMAAATDQPGWVGGQLLIPLDALNQRIIVGTWETRADWESWHDDPDFAATRLQLDDLEAAPGEHRWHEVIEDARASGRSMDAAA